VTNEPLIPKHGGYRKLKGFQVAQLAYDVTVRFVELYVDRFSRTKDQMVQAARSGVQNIAEGSLASATSKKTELKLTQVARASLEELKLDYEDFLRHRGLPMLKPQHPVLMRFKARKCATLADVQAWVAQERALQKSTDSHGQTKTNNDTQTAKNNRQPPPSPPSPSSPSSPPSVKVSDSPCQTPNPAALSSACLVANGALSLLNLACHLLDRQVERLAHDFENEGGFNERLYRVRSERRKQQKGF